MPKIIKKKQLVLANFIKGKNGKRSVIEDDLEDEISVDGDYIPGDDIDPPEDEVMASDEDENEDEDEDEDKNSDFDPNAGNRIGDDEEDDDEEEEDEEEEEEEVDEVVKGRRKIVKQQDELIKHAKAKMLFAEKNKSKKAKKVKIGSTTKTVLLKIPKIKKRKVSVGPHETVEERELNLKEAFKDGFMFGEEVGDGKPKEDTFGEEMKFGDSW